jgi:hypothetical protein
MLPAAVVAGASGTGGTALVPVTALVGAAPTGGKGRLEVVVVVVLVVMVVAVAVEAEGVVATVVGGGAAVSRLGPVAASVPPAHAAHSTTTAASIGSGRRSDRRVKGYEAVWRRGSFQFGRTKWQVYPFGIRCR